MTFFSLTFSRYSSSRSRSRSNSRHRRSKSRSSRSKSRSSRHSSKPKLVSTLRDVNINKPPPTARKTRSKSESSGGWSSDNGNHKRNKKSRRDWSRSTSPLIPLSEARKIRRAAEDAVNKEFAESDLAEKVKQTQKDRQLEEEAAEIERRMELEANGEIHLYSPDPVSHTPPPQVTASKSPEKEQSPKNSSEREIIVQEICINDELAVES